MENIASVLMQKKGIVISSLAKSFLFSRVDDQISTIRELSESLKVGHGTIQSALNELESLGAIKFSKRGYRGTVLTEINYDLLAKLAGVNSIVGAMPLPSSKRFEGLASGIFECLNSGHIQCNLAFMTGSKNRIDALMRKRYEFAVMSKHSAELYVKDNDKIEIVGVLSQESYIAYHVLASRDDVNEQFDAIRVGIDTSSDDQVNVTMDFFKNKNVTFVPVRYSNIIDSIENGVIDAAIWSTDNLDFNKKGIRLTKVRSHFTNMDETHAAIVVLKENEVISNYIRHNLNGEVVRDIQDSIIAGRRVAKY